MKILRAWIAPFPGTNARPSGLSNISFRVPLDEHCQHPLQLRAADWIKTAIDNREMHYSLGLIEDGSLIVLRDAINDYLLKDGNEYSI